MTANATKLGRLGLWIIRLLFVVAWGVVGFVATWLFAFGFYNVPFTTSGVHEVTMGAAPFGVLCGSLLGALIAYHWRRER
jgi:hypothetical protein